MRFLAIVYFYLCSFVSAQDIKVTQDEEEANRIYIAKLGFEEPRIILMEKDRLWIELSTYAQADHNQFITGITGLDVKLDLQTNILY